MLEAKGLAGQHSSNRVQVQRSGSSSRSAAALAGSFALHGVALALFLLVRLLAPPSEPTTDPVTMVFEAPAMADSAQPAVPRPAEPLPAPDPFPVKLSPEATQPMSITPAPLNEPLPPAPSAEPAPLPADLTPPLSTAGPEPVAPAPPAEQPASTDPAAPMLVAPPTVAVPVTPPLQPAAPAPPPPPKPAPRQPAAKVMRPPPTPRQAVPQAPETAPSGSTAQAHTKFLKA